MVSFSSFILLFSGFVLGLAFGSFRMASSISDVLEKKYAERARTERYEMWTYAWKYCVFRCLNEWSNPIENFAVKAAQETFDEWNDTIG